MLASPSASNFSSPAPSTDTLSVDQASHESERRKGKKPQVNFADEDEVEEFEQDEEEEEEPMVDYEQKYAPDEKNNELGRTARVWKMYMDEVNVHDQKQFEEWRDGLDVLIVFTALFTIVVSIFAAQTFQRLRIDHTSATSALLAELVEIERAISEGVPAEDIPRTNISFTPKTIDLWVNGLFFAAVTISLFTAVLAMLAKQWIRQLISIPSGDPRDCARIRQFRYDSFTKWHVPEIIAFFPVMMHLCLGLFFAGVVVFTFNFDRTMAIVMASMAGSVFVAYVVSTLLPLFYADCPFRTPLSFYSFSTYSSMHKRFFRKNRKPSFVEEHDEDEDEDDEHEAGEGDAMLKPEASSPSSSHTTLNDTEYEKIMADADNLDYSMLSWLYENTSEGPMRNAIGNLMRAHQVSDARRQEEGLTGNRNITI